MFCCIHKQKLQIAAAGIVLLMLPLAGEAFGAVRFSVVGSPTEVINTGRSEVVGSLNLVVQGVSNKTGTSTGGSTQIGLIFDNPPLQIDNTGTSGIKLFSSAGLAPAAPSIIDAENRLIDGHCSGFLAINLAAGATPAAGDFIRIEGIRARIDASAGILPGTDFFVDLQSVNDPSANSFNPDRIRIAKSLKGLVAEVVSDTLNYQIHITEGFARAFVDSDANNDGINFNDRTDSSGGPLGAPANSTQILVRLDGIPSGISSVVWPDASTRADTGAKLVLLDSSFSGGTSTATYSFETENQTGSSDLAVESFSLSPSLIFSGGECNTDHLTASVTLAPAVAAISGCSSPSADASRPRFLEVYELSLSRLSPSSVVVGSDATTLTVSGTGFVPGSTLLWNGSDRSTTYVSSSQLTAAIPAADLSRETSAKITVRNPPALGAATSNALSFAVTPHPLSLYFPFLVSNGDNAGLESSEFTGIALTNLSPRPATLKATAFDTNGEKIAGDNIVNPASLALAPGQQVPLLAPQIFGAGLQSLNPAGWIKVEGDVPEMAGLFLAFNGTLSRLDGADVSSKGLTSIVFPEIETSGFTRIHIANPNDEPVTLRFGLTKSDGTARAGDATRTLNPNGAIVTGLADLFPGVTAAGTDYVKVTSSAPVVPFEYLGKSGRDTEGLNGQDAGDGAARLYAPQYVVGGNDWRSILSLVNLSPVAGNVSMRFIQDDGTQIGSTQVVSIAAGGKVRIDDQSFFVDAGDTLKQGYLEIAGSTGVKLAGSILFESSVHPFAAALPLVSNLATNLVFGQVASNDIFFTGLSLANPADTAARAVIQVFSAEGKQVAAKMMDIPAGGRAAGLLTEFFPGLLGRNIGAGYVTVDVLSGALTAFEVYGTQDLSVLSAVAAQPARF